MPCCPYLRLGSLVGMIAVIAVLAALVMPHSPPVGPVALAAEKPAEKKTDWPLFRGNTLQTGVADATLPDKLKVRWKFTTLDSIETAAAIVNGVVYVGSLDQHLYAIDLATGKEKWKVKSDIFKAPPSVRNGLVYVGDGDGNFFCLDAATGKEKWKFTADGEIPSGANFSGDRVLFGCADEKLYCLDAATGKKEWEFKIDGGPVNASPVVVEGRTFVAGCDSNLHVIEVATGKELATVDLGGQVGATAAVSGDHLFVGTMTSEVIGVDWKKSNVLWRFEPQRARAFYASGAVTDKLIVTGNRNNKVYGIDRKIGAEVWSFATRNVVDSSPVVVGKRVYVGSMDRNLYVLDLEKGTEIARYDLEDGAAASPAVAGGCLVIGTTKGEVYCFE